MTKRTYEIDANNIEVARDFEEIVKDKREQWRANITKSRQRQRRYKKTPYEATIKKIYLIFRIN